MIRSPKAVFLQSWKLIHAVLSGTSSPEDSAAASAENPASNGGQVCAFVSSVLLWSLGAISLRLFFFSFFFFFPYLKFAVSVTSVC